MRYYKFSCVTIWVPVYVWQNVFTFLLRPLWINGAGELQVPVKEGCRRRHLSVSDFRRNNLDKFICLNKWVSGFCLPPHLRILPIKCIGGVTTLCSAGQRVSQKASIAARRQRNTCQAWFRFGLGMNVTSPSPGTVKDKLEVIFPWLAANFKEWMNLTTFGGGNCQPLLT